LRRAGAHIDQIGFRQVGRHAGCCLHVDIYQVFQIFAGARGQPLIDLIGMHAAACADEMREDRRVVAASSANLQDGLALLDLAGAEPVSVVNRERAASDRRSRRQAGSSVIGRRRSERISWSTETDASTIETICAKLDGLPLAIELAAARMRTLSPLVLLQKLDKQLPLLTGGGRDQLPRLQSMRAAIAWSFDLLPRDEQWLLAGWPFSSADSPSRRRKSLPASRQRP